MKDEIRQDGKAVLKSEDGVSIPMFFNNLCGKNFSGTQYRDYIRNIALGEWASNPDESSSTVTACCKGREKYRSSELQAPKNQQREIYNLMICKYGN